MFGGSIVDPKPFNAALEEAISKLMALDADNEVPLGALIWSHVGVCRHRSILFKYLCDHMHRFPDQWALSAAPASATDSSGVVRGAIPCQLVRGMQSAVAGTGAGENHMWNVVRLGDELYVVDVMQRPGELLPAESKEAQAYQRVILTSAVDGKHAQVASRRL